MNIAIIDDVQQDLDALAEAAREHYDQNRYLSNYIPSLHLKISGTAILPAVMTDFS